MSVLCNIRQVSSNVLRQHISQDNNGPLTVDLTDPERSMRTIERMKRTGVPSALIQEIETNFSVGQALSLKPHLEIGKYWNGVHWGLTGQSEGGRPPLSLTVVGDQEFGDDTGYGPARALSSKQVADIAQALEDFGEERFRTGLLREQMIAAQIYLAKDVDPAEWDVLVEGLEQCFLKIKTLYCQASTAGDCMVVWYN